MDEKEDFVAFPVNNLVAVFEDVESLNATVNELQGNGFAEDEIRSFVGEEGIAKLDFDGSRHGPLAELLRYLQHIGPDRTYLERYKKYMQDGDSLLMVNAPKQDRREAAAEIMRKHSTHRVTYFGPLVIEEV
jgi:hypothetical protein